MEQSMLTIGSDRIPLERLLELQNARYGGELPQPGQRIASERPGGAGFYRATLKRKAADLSRSVSETFSFCTSANLSHRMGNHFLEAFTNEGFAPCDVPFRSLHAMGDAVINAMLPESEMKTVRISLVW